MFCLFIIGIISVVVVPISIKIQLFFMYFIALDVPTQLAAAAFNGFSRISSYDLSPSNVTNLTILSLNIVITFLDMSRTPSVLLSYESANSAVIVTQTTSILSKSSCDSFKRHSGNLSFSIHIGRYSFDFLIDFICFSSFISMIAQSVFAPPISNPIIFIVSSSLLFCYL